LPLESISMKLVVLTAAGSARHGSLVQIILCSEKNLVGIKFGDCGQNTIFFKILRILNLPIRSLDQNDITSMRGRRLAQGNVRKYKNCEYDQLPASHV